MLPIIGHLGVRLESKVRYDQILQNTAVTLPPPPAGWRRLHSGDVVQLAKTSACFLARLIDYLVLTCLIVIPTIAVVVILYDLTTMGQTDTIDKNQRGIIDDNMSVLVIWLFWVLFLGVIIVLFESFMLVRRGQTFGQIITNVEVIRADNGKHPNWGQAIARTLLIWFLGVLTFITVIWNRNSQGLHNQAASTLVIVRRRDADNVAQSN